MNKNYIYLKLQRNKEKMKVYSRLVRKNNFPYYINFLSIYTHLHQVVIVEKTVEDYVTR